MKFRQWPKRDPNKNYFLVPNEVLNTPPPDGHLNRPSQTP